MNRNSVTASTVTHRSYEKTTFDSVMILTDKATFDEPFRTYQQSTGFLEDNADPELVKAGLALFGQQPKITTVIVAKTDNSNTDLGTLIVTMVALDAIVEDDFFSVNVVSAHSDDQLIELAKYIETTEFMCTLYTNNNGVIASTTTDLAYRVKELGLRHTSVHFHATERLDMAFISRFLGEDIGLVSAKHLVLPLIPASKLTNSETSNAMAKNCNIYDKERKKFIFTKDGLTGSGENIKSVAGEIFIRVTAIEAVYEVLLNNSNISFNSKDIKKLRVAINTRMKIAQDQKIIAENDPELGTSYLIEIIPLRAESKITFRIKYLEAGTVKYVDIEFTAFKDDDQFNIEREG